MRAEDSPALDIAEIEALRRAAFEREEAERIAREAAEEAAAMKEAEDDEDDEDSEDAESGYWSKFTREKQCKEKHAKDKIRLLWSGAIFCLLKSYK